MQWKRGSKGEGVKIGGGAKWRVGGGEREREVTTHTSLCAHVDTNLKLLHSFTGRLRFGKVHKSTAPFTDESNRVYFTKPTAHVNESAR